MVAYSVLLPVRHTDWGLRDYGTAKWEGGDPECKHNPQRPDGGERSDRTLPLGRGGLYRDICGKCGATRIDNQLGLERTPEEYIANMVAVFRECWRVLRDDGTLWLNVGDSFGSPPGRNDTNRSGVDGFTGSNGKYGTSNISKSPHDGKTGLKPKDLVGIPWRLAFALQADGWYLRSDIIWSKPNPMPESVRDRPTKSHEYLFLLAKQDHYYYDQEAIREKNIRLWDETNIGINNRINTGVLEGKVLGRDSNPHCGLANTLPNPAGRNRRTVWTIPTAPYKGAHFATFPPALVEPCIKAGTSERGACPKCGKGWRRVTERDSNYGNSEDEYSGKQITMDPQHSGRRMLLNMKRMREQGRDHDNPFPKKETLGWQPACTCDAGDPIPCLVFDPFVGSGTTVKVAYDLGRRGVGLDLSLEYLDEQARKRIHNGHIARLF